MPSKYPIKSFRSPIFILYSIYKMSDFRFMWGLTIGIFANLYSVYGGVFPEIYRIQANIFIAYKNQSAYKNLRTTHVGTKSAKRSLAATQNYPNGSFLFSWV